MFSNQYMGTRLASRSLPRPTNIAGSLNKPLYGRVYSYEATQRPVNARPNATDNEEEEVDYSFMNLPVRERRKMFLGEDSRTLGFHRGGYQTMTVPRTRNFGRHHTGRFETQSEYGGGDNSSRWESSVAPYWSAGTRSVPASTNHKSSATKTIVINPPSQHRTVHQFPEVERNRYLRHTSEVYPSTHFQPYGMGRSYHQSAQPLLESMSHNSQYPTTVHIHDSRSHVPQSRIVNNASVRVYPTQRYGSVVTSPRDAYSNSGSTMTNMSSAAVSGRIIQPLRVNVYNSDPSTAQLISNGRITTRAAISPLYPAYPAHYEKSPVEIQSPRERSRRGHSVQPTIVHHANVSPVFRRAEPQQYWKSYQTPAWAESGVEKRQGRYISMTRRDAGRAITQEMEKPPGTSEF